MTDVVPAGKTPAGTFFCADLKKCTRKSFDFRENMLQKPSGLCKIYIMMFWFSGRLPNGNFAKHA
ncbi:hypothetical protein [Gemmiger formicilis]|uniref:hypothetical protein n=1 Tax=Gemmiger formicilis TaxID=745368 RepID=UPI0039962F0E